VLGFPGTGAFCIGICCPPGLAKFAQSKTMTWQPSMASSSLTTKGLRGIALRQLEANIAATRLAFLPKVNNRLRSLCEQQWKELRHVRINFASFRSETPGFPETLRHHGQRVGRGRHGHFDDDRRAG
jgi:hypothetical protein